MGTSEALKLFQLLRVAVTPLNSPALVPAWKCLHVQISGIPACCITSYIATPSASWVGMPNAPNPPCRTTRTLIGITPGDKEIKNRVTHARYHQGSLDITVAQDTTPGDKKQKSR